MQGHNAEYGQIGLTGRMRQRSTYGSAWIHCTKQKGLRCFDSWCLCEDLDLLSSTSPTTARWSKPNELKIYYFPASDLSCTEDVDLSYHLFWMHFKKFSWIFITLLLDRLPHCIVSAFSLHPTLQNMVQFYHIFIRNEFNPFAARLLRGEFNCWTIYIAIYLADIYYVHLLWKFFL